MQGFFYFCGLDKKGYTLKYYNVNLVEIEILKGNALDKASIEELRNQILTNITTNENSIIFTCLDGRKYKMYHIQECSEQVTIEDINGNLDDLVGVPILISEETTKEDDDCDFYTTYTFYKMATIKGYVTIRWIGESNGYYSEKVDFVRIK